MTPPLYISGQIAEYYIAHAYIADCRDSPQTRTLLLQWGFAIDEIAKLDHQSAIDHCTLALCVKQSFKQDVEYELPESTDEDFPWTSSSARTILAKREQLANHPKYIC